MPRRSRSNAWRVGAAAAACGAAACIAITACSGPLSAPIPAASDDPAGPRRGGTLHVASMAEMRGLDPAGPTEGLGLEAIHLLFAGLVDFDAHARPAPDLADHWEVEDGGRTYRFVLRPGVVMHDGAELTADDVKRSAERSLHPTSPNPDASYFTDIAGYAEYAAGKAEHLDGVVVEGRYVVSFHLTEPDATFLPLLAMQTLRPVCRSGGDRYSTRWMPCGAGPFKLLAGDWQRGTSLRLVRHDAYFRPGLPRLDAVEWTFNMQLLSQRFRFEAGELDFLHDMTQGDQTRFARDPRWKALGETEPDTSTNGESMNTRVPPFDNVEVRRAVAAAIDRDHYRLLKPAYVAPLAQLLPPDLPGYDPTVEGQRTDYAAALEHMKKAGYPYDPATGEGGWPAPIPYILYDRGLLVSTAQILQQDLARIGLRLDLRLLSWPAFLAVQERPDGAAMSQGAWAMDYPDPSSFFDPLFATSSIGAESSFNISFYSNPRFDDLVARARHELDPGRRMALYHDAGTILCDDAPWAFTYGYHEFDVRQPYVRQLLAHPVWSLDPTEAWLARAGDAIRRAIGEPLRSAP